MTIESKIICDSVGPNRVRLTTFLLKYPRFIHSEFMTHRMFSRNASSSRAIPFERQMKMIEEDIAMPLEFRQNQKGMQAGEAFDEYTQEGMRNQWKTAAKSAIHYAQSLALMGVHKQYVNRLVEPFAHITVVVSATEYSNFFALRHHSMAQPEIAELAKKMWDTYSIATPKTLKAGEWHLPFISEAELTAQVDFENETVNWEPLIKMSVARCARTSYLNHDSTIPTMEDDYKLYDRLLKDPPIHASPAEHQAQAIGEERFVLDFDTGHYPVSTANDFSGNFRGWTQYRKTLKGENIVEFKGSLG